MPEKIFKSNTEWEQESTPEQYRVTRLKGTEMPFPGEYRDNHEEGMYLCACSGPELFSSEFTKSD